MISLSDQLNPSQIEAVETLDGPLLILAGAGSGKTRVLTYRIANLVLQGKASPESILAVTFTNKAAQEMKHRALQLLDKFGVTYYSPPWVSTFHSFCSGVLRSDIYKLGYDRNFTIYDRTDQLSLIRKIFEELNIDSKTYSPKIFLARINDSKTQNISPEDLKDAAVHSIDELIADTYAKYEKKMKEVNALDFEDLLIKTIELFEGHPDVLEKYNQMLRYILVDEYQDTNPTQYRIIQLLSKAHRNLCAVGDEDQSIYSWRGADIQNILSFEKDFPETKVIKLEENYRSSGTIVKAASSLIQNNSTRKEKVLFTKNKLGEKISIREMPDEYAEARWATQNILNLMRSDNYAYSDFAVFYRTNAQSRVIEEELRSNRIPYQIIGGVKFYDRMEIKDLIGYLRLLLNPKDDVAFLRILNVPSRGIGKTSEKKLLDFALENEISMLEAANRCVQKNVGDRLFSGAITKKLEDFLTMFVSLQAFMNDHKPSETFTALLDQTKYVDYLKAEKPEDAPARIDNINELLNALTQFEQERGEEGTLANFLEQIALVSDIDEMNDDNKCVKLMTLHISKGLEFPVVFMIGVEEGLFPSAQAMDSLDPLEIEEERRLAYVGMTRAKVKLFMTFARKRRQWGQEQFNPPSRFLKEVPQEFVEASTTFVQPRRPTNYNFDPDQVQYDTFPDYDSDSSSSGNEWRKGTKVRHPTFGVGTIYTTEGSGEEQKVVIMFPNHSLKKFILKYARLERV